MKRSFLMLMLFIVGAIVMSAAVPAVPEEEDEVAAEFVKVLGCGNCTAIISQGP